MMTRHLSKQKSTLTWKSLNGGHAVDAYTDRQPPYGMDRPAFQSGSGSRSNGDRADSTAPASIWQLGNVCFVPGRGSRLRSCVVLRGELAELASKLIEDVLSEVVSTPGIKNLGPALGLEHGKHTKYIRTGEYKVTTITVSFNPASTVPHPSSHPHGLPP